MAPGIRQMILLFWVAISMILAPNAAYAQNTFATLTCNSDGSVAGGELYGYYSNVGVDNGSCKFTTAGSGIDLTHIFSQVVCDFVLILNDIMGKMYCGIQQAITQVLALVLTLYVLVFGARMLMGNVQLNAKEFIIHMLKIAAVWALCTQSTWGVGFLFHFFIVLMADASSWVVNGVLAGPSYAAIFNSIGIPMAADSPGATPPMFGFLDTLFYHILTGPLAAGDNKVVGFFIALLSVILPVPFMGIWWIINTMLTFLKTVATFLMCLAAIAFLITLSPIFLACMLFQSTQHFFEGWIRYITSYTIQIIFVFAIFIFWILIMVQFTGFYDTMAGVIFPYKNKDLVLGADYVPEDTWGLCPYNFTTDNGVPEISCENPEFNSDLSNGGNESDMSQVILPAEIPTQMDFLEYLFYNLISLMIITFAFRELLKNAQPIATSLSGAQPPSLVAGGWGNGTFGALGGGKPLQSLLGSGKPSTNFVNMFRNAVGLPVEEADEGSERLNKAKEQAEGLIAKVEALIRVPGISADLKDSIQTEIQHLNTAINLRDTDAINRRIEILSQLERRARRGG